MTTTALPDDRLIALSRELLEEQTLLTGLSDVHKHINEIRSTLNSLQQSLMDFEKSIEIRPNGKHVVNIELVAAHSAVMTYAMKLLKEPTDSLDTVLNILIEQCDAIECRFDRTECPRCGEVIPSVEHRGEYLGAISRLDNKTEICSTCGNEEAFGGLMGAWHTLISSVIEGKYRHAHPELSNSKGA